MDNTPNREWIMDGLKKSIQRLSLPPEQCLSSIPPGALKIDELALDYDNFFAAATSNFRDEFTMEQFELLNSLNDRLDAIRVRAASGSDNQEYWTERSFKSDSEWEDIRCIAKAAMKSLNLKKPKRLANKSLEKSTDKR